MYILIHYAPDKMIFLLSSLLAVAGDDRAILVLLLLLLASSDFDVFWLTDSSDFSLAELTSSFRKRRNRIYS